MSNLPEGYPQAIGPGQVPTLDFQGEPDGRTWYMREKVLEDALAEAKAERDFLRELVRTLAQNTGTEPK